MPNILYKLIANRFASAVVVVLTLIAVRYFGVEQAQAQESASGIIQPLADFVGLLLACGVNYLIHHMQANSTTNAQSKALEFEHDFRDVVQALDKGKTADNPKVIHLTSQVKAFMGVRARHKVKQFQEQNQGKNKDLRAFLPPENRT